MGQYYKAYLLRMDGEATVFNRSVNGEYMMAKIMEHSWWENEFMRIFTGRLYHNPGYVAWVGDYADSDGKFGCSSDLYHLVWDAGVKDVGVSTEEDMPDLEGKYLVNHTDRTYIDCSAYYERSNRDGWCIHPLSILTAVGNGQGGGDYRGTDMGWVGEWAMNLISVEDNPLPGYTAVTPTFVE